MLKRLTGTETEVSKLLLDQWLTSDQANIQKYKEAKILWELTGQLHSEVPDRSFKQFQEYLGTAAQNNVAKDFSSWKYGIAAILAGIVLLASLYHYKFNPARSAEEKWVIKKAEAGKMIKITLPDSSLVWLNSGTEITFSRDFNELEIRAVKLKGEAYFEVRHNANHPFVVSSAKLLTTVYGTSFSVRAYENETNSTVAVNSGKVGVSATNEPHPNNTVMLLPNDKLSYSNQEGKFVKSLIVNEDVDAWIRGELVFEQSPLKEVLETLSRKYKVKINCGNNTYAGCRLTARFKNQPIQTVLKALRRALDIQSKQIGETIYLKGGNCM